VKIYPSIPRPWTALSLSTAARVRSTAAAIGYLAAFYLEPRGVIGRQEAVNNQRLLIGGGDPTAAFGPGEAVFWRQGEAHEARAGAV
jgi:hypothetical protein